MPLSEPRIRVPHDRTRQHLSRRALEDHLAEIEYIDVLADLTHQRHVVLNQEDADATLSDRAYQDLPEASRLHGVEPRGRFVEQEEIERPGKDARQFDHAALAGRK